MNLGVNFMSLGAQVPMQRYKSSCLSFGPSNPFWVFGPSQPLFRVKSRRMRFIAGSSQLDLLPEHVC